MAKAGIAKAKQLKKPQRSAKTASAVDLAWFKAKLQQMGRSQRDLARQLGRDYSAATQLLRGRRKLDSAELPVMARFFGVPEAEILRRFGHLPAGAGESSNTIEITGWVDDNLETHAGAPEGARYAPAPKEPGLVAIRVRAPGGAGGLPDGTTLYYAPGTGVGPEAVDRLCVVRLASGGPERVRMVRRGYVGGAYNLHDMRGLILEQNALLLVAMPVVWTRM